MAVWLKFLASRQISLGTSCARHSAAEIIIIAVKGRGAVGFRCWEAGGVGWRFWTWLVAFCNSLYFPLNPQTTYFLHLSRPSTWSSITAPPSCVTGSLPSSCTGHYQRAPIRVNCFPYSRFVLELYWSILLEFFSTSPLVSETS